MNIKENYMALLNGEKPERLVNQYEPFAFVLNEPLLAQTMEGRIEGEDAKDARGVTMRWKKGDHAGMPYVTDNNKVCPDVCDWRNTVKAPSLDFPEETWQDAIRVAAAVDRNEYLVTGLMATGLFERCHFLMGFEDTLMNFLMEPEAMHELLDYLLDWRMEYAKQLIDHLQPDAILSHDDWGAKDRLFMSAETWREFFKPRYEKLYSYIRNRGVQVIHHADSYCANIIEDMVDIHIQVWQGVLPDNDIPKLQRQLNGRMVLMGGINGGVFDFPEWKEEEVRREVRRACNASKGLGGFIPCITYGLPETIYPGVFEIIEDEINIINTEV